MSEKTNLCPVNSYNEWDPLEEVIVGRPAGAAIPGWDTIEEVIVSPGEWEEIVEHFGGQYGAPYPQEIIEAAQQELAEFVHILEAEGVKVRRPDVLSYSNSYKTPEWEVPTGFCAANPRDVFLVIGNEIIEAPMADRNRYFEAWAYRSLLKEYFKAGAKWTAAPKPQLSDALYDPDYRLPEPGEDMRFIITEFEPTFDAADFVRCGRDIFGQKSHVTNDLGIEWLRRHLGDEYRIHILETRDRHAIHIDTTFVPLAPGKVLVNPEFLDPEKLPPILKNWDILIAPEPAYVPKELLNVLSPWISINVLMLDEERVIVEKEQEPLIKALKEWGFKPIPCSFKHHYPFSGAFHCATLDVRRRGELKSYF